MSDAIRPFTINVSDEQIADLRDRLARTRWAEKRYTNIGYWNELDAGGHFAAWEQPEVFVNEVRAAFRIL